jgi:hypothetical protein
MTRRRLDTPGKLIGAGAVFLVLGGLLAGPALPRFLDQRRAKGWPSVEGTVSLAEHRGGKNPRVDLEYSYAVDGRQYFGKASPAEGRVSLPYSVGSPVTVHYHPSQAERSVILLDQESTDSLVMMLGGSALLAVGLYMAGSGLRWRSTGEAPSNFLVG